jgi:hypothetical protein
MEGGPRRDSGRPNHPRPIRREDYTRKELRKDPETP